MVKLTTANQLNISVDTRELLRDKASYTIDSLIELQANHPDSPLCFIMGMDSLLSFNSWHRWEEILDHCHIIVSHRPGWRFELNSPLQNLVANHQTDQISDLHTLPSGKIYFQKTTQLDISSTQIRSLIKENKSVEFLLPEKVITYIKDKQIYQ